MDSNRQIRDEKFETIKICGFDNVFAISDE